MEMCNRLIPCCGCADMEICTKKKNNLMTLKDVIKENMNGKYLAVCDDGEYYAAEYSAKYKTMFFAINSDKNIIGYFKKGR